MSFTINGQPNTTVRLEKASQTESSVTNSPKTYTWINNYTLDTNGTYSFWTSTSNQSWQVYRCRAASGHATSTNSVGYVTTTITSNYFALSNPFNRGDNTLGTVLPYTLDGISIYLWDKAQQQYGNANTFFWGSWDDDTMVLNPGEGFMLYNDSSNPTTNVSFYGFVPEGTLYAATTMTNTNNNALSPLTIDMNSNPSSGLTTQIGDSISIWNVAQQSWNVTNVYSAGQTPWDYTTDKVTGSIGKFFFYKGNQSYQRTFHVWDGFYTP
jgi:hypothetical protein